jgi:predicted nucleic acid-binding protein
MRILLDTNILIYADNTDSNFSEICNAIIENNLPNRSVEIVIPQKVLIEYYRVSTSKAINLSPQKVIDNIQYYIENFEILYDNYDITQTLFELAMETNAKSGKIFDLNILALAIDNNIDHLITYNIKDFPKAQKLKVMTPEDFCKLM